MRAIARRLHRLEQRLGPPVESWETREVLARLNAARLRRGLPPPSAERTRELRGMSITQILNSSRQRAAEAHRSELDSVPCAELSTNVPGEAVRKRGED